MYDTSLFHRSDLILVLGLQYNWLFPPALVMQIGLAVSLCMNTVCNVILQRHSYNAETTRWAGIMTRVAHLRWSSIGGCHILAKII